MNAWGTGGVRTYWVIHEVQILGAASDDDAWPGLEGDRKAVPLPDDVACAPCRHPHGCLASF